MPRKTINYSVIDNNRDQGKVFVITEMSSNKAEAWALRALLALMSNNAEIPEDFENMGVAGLAELGFKALSGLKWEVLEPLLAEMLECVQYMPDPKTPQVIRAIWDEDIEEVSTRIKLRAEVWKLHTDFLKAVASLSSNDTETLAAVTPKGSRVIKTYRK
jgi:hypothetical protein